MDGLLTTTALDPAVQAIERCRVVYNRYTGKDEDADRWHADLGAAELKAAAVGPVTIEGAVAYLQWLAEDMAEGDVDDHSVTCRIPMLRSVIAFLEQRAQPLARASGAA